MHYHWRGRQYVARPDGGLRCCFLGGSSASAGVKIVNKEKTNLGKVGGYAFIDVKTGIVSRMSIYAESSMSTELHAQQASSGRTIDVKLAGMLEVKLQRQ